MKRMIGILLVAVALAVAAAGSAAAQGLIGGNLETARSNSDFFTFFHLEPTGPVAAPGAIEFRPSGPQFRALVRVTATVDRQGMIVAMSLAVLRSFIDDPQNGIFADDIAKSFLRDAPPAEDEAALAPLAEAIERRQTEPAQAPPTEYAIYIGAVARTLARHLARTDFRIEPSRDAGQRALTLSLALR